MSTLKKLEMNRDKLNKLRGRRQEVWKIEYQHFPEKRNIFGDIVRFAHGFPKLVICKWPDGSAKIINHAPITASDLYKLQKAGEMKSIQKNK